MQNSSKTFKAGEIIFAEGDYSQYLFLLKKGEIRYLKFEGNQLAIKSHHLENIILNEVSVLLGEPLDFSAQAVTDCEIALVESKEIHSVLKICPDWVGQLTKSLCQRLLVTEQVLANNNISTNENGHHYIPASEELVTKQLIAAARGKK